MSLGHAARRNARTAAVAIRFGEFSRNHDRYAIDPARLREQLELGIGNLASRRQEFGGFVDFLMGRGARHPR